MSIQHNQSLEYYPLLEEKQILRILFYIEYVSPFSPRDVIYFDKVALYLFVLLIGS